MPLAPGTWITDYFGAPCKIVTYGRLKYGKKGIPGYIVERATGTDFVPEEDAKPINPPETA